MSDLVVQTAFTAKGDTVTTALNRQAKAADTMGSRLRNAFAGGAKQAGMFGSMLAANLASKAITSALSNLTRGVRAVAGEWIDFDTAISAAADSGAISLDRGTEAFHDFELAARNVAATTKYGAADAAGALKSLGEQGFNAAQAMDALPGIATFATASELDLATAAELTGDAMGAFLLMSDDAAIQAENLAWSNDVLAKMLDTSKIGTEEFTAALKTSGAAFGAAGQDMSTYTAILGQMSNSGMEATDAGSKLTMMMKGLAAPSKAALQAQKKLGISMYDKKGQMRDLIDFLGDYEKATGKMTQAQRNAYTSTIFGKRGLDGVNATLALGVDGLAQYRDELANSGGTAAKEAQAIEKSLGYKLESLQSSAIEVGFRILKSFGGEGKNAIDELSKALLEFDVKPIVEGLNSMLDALKWLFRTVKDHWKTIKAVAISFAAIKVAISGMSFINAIAGFGKMASAATAAATASTAAGAAANGAGGVAPVAAGTSPGGMAAGGVAAAAIGYSIGTAIEENLLNPMRLAGEKMELELNNLVHKFGGVGRGAVDIEAMSPDQLMGGMKQIEASLKSQKSPITSIENAVQQQLSDAVTLSAKAREFFGFLSADQAKAVIEENKGPIQTQREQMEQLTLIYQEMAVKLMQAKAEIDAAAKAATTEINVNVANAPAGTSVEAKGTPQPKVNQGQAGKS